MAGRRRSINIRISRETHERLRALMEPGETFDGVIRRLLDRVRELEEKVVALERSLPLEVERRVQQKVAELAEEKVRKEIDAVSLDKASWYITKLVFSVQALKDLVTGGAPRQEVEKQLDRLTRVLSQIRERYGVRTEMLRQIAVQFVTEPRRENMILLNEATKETVKSVFIKMLGFEVAR